MDAGRTVVQRLHQANALAEQHHAEADRQSHQQRQCGQNHLVVSYETSEAAQYVAWLDWHGVAPGILPPFRSPRAALRVREALDGNRGRRASGWETRQP